MSLSNRLGLLGRKVGMMRIYTDDGDAVPVTVLDVSNNRVTQVKTEENDGYVALQVTFGARKSSRVTKPAAGHLAKAGVEAGEIIQEFRVTADTAAKYAAGATVPVADLFTGLYATTAILAALQERHRQVARRQRAAQGDLFEGLTRFGHGDVSALSKHGTIARARQV